MGWEDNILMDLRGKVWRVWTGFIWLRIGTNMLALVNTVMNF
jgi:hypothetical protein